MKSAAASAPLTPFTGPFAIGTLSAPGEARFPALVTPDGQVLDLRTALDEPALTTLALLGRWDEELPRLHTLAGDPAGNWRTWRCTRPSSPGRSSSPAPTTGST